MTPFVNLLLVAYLPGALLFRLPIANRSRRAALAAEERAFWAIVLSATLSSTGGLLLAALGIFSINRLLLVNGALSLVFVLASRGRLRLGPDALWPRWSALVPLGLITIGLWLYFPPAEYIMGGKDPGTYMNQGIQIAQRGSLVTHDPLVARVPTPARDLFFPPRLEPGYYGIRFMGFFILNPDSGDVLGQFPHLFPVWIAIGYGIHGLTGARQAVAVWAILGLLAVYFAASRLVGRVAAAAGATLLAIHIVQVWFARYPNSETVMQALAFAALLAFARAHQDGDRFFAPVSGVLFPLLLFTRIDSGLILAGVAAAVWLDWLRGRRPLRWFLVPFAAGVGIAAIYLLTVMAAYIASPLGMLKYLGRLQLMMVGAGTVIAVWLSVMARRLELESTLVRWVPMTLATTVVLAAAYAYFWREAGGQTAPHDADALRTYGAFYLTPYGLAAATVGFLLVVGRGFWRDPALLLATMAFALFVFYKIRIVPEHFWMARRFVPLILPMSLVLTAAAAFSGAGTSDWRGAGLRDRRRLLSATIGLAFLLLLGWRFFEATGAIRHHVEYAGLIPRLEKLAALFGERDLVIVEARNASDLHVLALPLAYIYARDVLVLDSPRPDKQRFAEFVVWARSRYREVFFIGGGGTDLLSRSLAVTAVASDRFQVPEYDSPRNAYPRGVRRKEWDFGIYRFITPRGGRPWFSLDVGTMDDLHVVRFHAKERHKDQRTFRWTRDYSLISILSSQPDATVLTVWMSDGGRPAKAGPARVELSINDRVIGRVIVGPGFQPYTFVLPPDLAHAMATSEQAALLKIATMPWSPRELLGTPDDRQIGVMVDRVELK